MSCFPVSADVPRRLQAIARELDDGGSQTDAVALLEFTVSQHGSLANGRLADDLELAICLCLCGLRQTARQVVQEASARFYPPKMYVAGPLPGMARLILRTDGGNNTSV